MISPETIARVKERTDIVALIAETVRLTRRGRSFVGLCPFHQEKTPSFHVSAERGRYHCFGCKEGGGAVDFVMKTEGCTFPEAVRMLAERAGIEVVDNATEAEQREANAARKAREDLFTANSAAATFFERCLRGTSAHALARYAREELLRRGLPMPEEDDAVGEAARVGDTLQAFRVGYAPYGWDGLANHLRQQGISPVIAERVGLLVPRQGGSGHYDRFRHRLMFAVSDVMGRVIAFSGRALPEPPADELASLKIATMSAGAADQAPAKYINSPESPIYTKGEHLFGLHQARQAVRTLGEAILVEGNFDVVSLHARGVSHAVAPLGTAFTTAQAKLLKRFAPRVTVLFDGDAAGRKATRAARIPCREGGLDAKVASLPQGADPDDYAQRHGAEGLARLLKNARGMREHLLEDALDIEAFRSGSIEEQRARLGAVMQLLAEERDPTQRAMVKTYADRLASKLLIGGRPLANLRELEIAVEQALGSAPIPACPAAERRDQARSRAREEDLPPVILGALLDFPELLDDPAVEAALTTLDGDIALAVVKLRGTLLRHPTTDPGSTEEPDQGGSVTAGRGSRGEIGVRADEFLAQIPRSIHSFAVGRLASPAFDALDKARAVLLENARKLNSLSLKRENAADNEQLHRVQAQGDADKENELLRAAIERAQKRRRRT